MQGLTRGAMTLIGAAAAGLLLWLGTQVDAGSNGGYWAFIGLTAAAGLTIALSQLLGGWTKWGWPTISKNVLLIAFVPALVAGGWVILANQPGSNWFQTHATSWAGDIGLGGLLDDLTAIVPAIAFGLGLLFGLVFDTTGPRVPKAEPAEQRVAREDDLVATEPVTAERTGRADLVDEDVDYREPDSEAVTAPTGRRDRKVEIREGGSPIAPQPNDDDDRATT
jgi:hypothetical protein